MAAKNVESPPRVGPVGREVGRLTYDRAAKAVTYRSDKSEGPTAGTETADPLEFLARVLTHIPDKGQVTTSASSSTPVADSLPQTSRAISRSRAW